MTHNNRLTHSFCQRVCVSHRNAFCRVVTRRRRNDFILLQQLQPQLLNYVSTQSAQNPIFHRALLGNLYTIPGEWFHFFEHTITSHVYALFTSTYWYTYTTFRQLVLKRIRLKSLSKRRVKKSKLNNVQNKYAKIQMWCDLLSKRCNLFVNYLK